MQWTRRELIDDFLGFVTEAGDAVARDVAERVLNRAIEALWLKHDWLQFQSPQPYEIATAAGQRHYALPAHYGRMGPGLVRNLTNGVALPSLEPADLDALAPGYGTSLDTARSAPRHYILRGTCGVFQQPDVSAGWELEALSSSTNDTDITVSLEGEDTNGMQQRVRVTLSGSTPVSCGTWRYVDHFGKSFPTAITPGTSSGTVEQTTSRGTVTLRRVTVGTALQQLFADESARQHQLFSLYPTPDAVYVIGCPIHRAPARLLYDADPLPAFWAPATFEEMQVQWRVNTGELSLDQATTMIRPACSMLRERLSEKW